MRILHALGVVSIALVASSSFAATTFVDGVDAPTIFNQLVVGDFDDGTTQGWAPVRIESIGSVDGTLQNTNAAGLGSDGNADSYVRLSTGSGNALPGVDAFKVGELPGQYDVVQFDLRFDTFPPEDPAQPGTGLINPSLRSRHFLQGGSTHGVNFISNSQLQALKDANDTSFHTYTIVRDFNDAAWEAIENVIRIDVIDGLNNNAGNSDSVLGTKFSIDNVILGRTTATQAFPAIALNPTNIIRNGDLSDTSNVSITGTNTGAFNINGGNGNYGPFRGNTGDVDHWSPYNNNPNSIVEAVADGGALDLTHDTNGTEGSFYLDTHWSTGAEQFSLNTAGGYLNGLIQTDVLNGVTIDDSATYELGFDIAFSATRPSNGNSNFKVALTVGTDSTDPATAVAGSLFDEQLSSITEQGTQTVSISGAALKAAQDTGQPVNLIVQSQANTSIVNFPGTPVPNNHVDGNVFTQVQVDNLTLAKTFTVPAGDVNKDGIVTQADVNLAQLYLDGNGGETAMKRQDDLFNAPSAPFEADILASLNLTAFDLNGDDYFDADDVAAIDALAVDLPGDFDGDGDVDGADFLGWQRSDPSQIPTWQSNYGPGTLAASTAAVPEPTSLMLIGLALSAATALGRRSR